MGTGHGVWGGVFLLTNRAWQKLTECHFWDWVTKRLWCHSFISSLFFLSLSFMSQFFNLSWPPHFEETSCYIVNNHIERSMWKGTEFSLQQPLKIWRTPATTGVSLETDIFPSWAMRWLQLWLTAYVQSCERACIRCMMPSQLPDPEKLWTNEYKLF